jgi:hypothetical protein
VIGWAEKDQQQGASYEEQSEQPAKAFIIIYGVQFCWHCFRQSSCACAEYSGGL